MNNKGPIIMIQLAPNFIYYNCYRAEKEEIIRLFRGAKRLIQQNKQKYICYALQSAWYSTQNSYRWVSAEALTVAQGIIRTRLGRYETIERWLLREVGVNPFLVHKENTQPYRLRWIDAIIKELES